MITVHHCTNARSMRIIWLLEELGVPHQVEKKAFSPEVLQSPAHLALHPLGSIPAVAFDGMVLWESIAVMEHILETHDPAGTLAPKPGAPERGPFLQWLHFSEATATPPVVQVLQHGFIRPEERRVALIEEEARARVGLVFDLVETRLGENAYLAGDRFTAADIGLGYALHLASLIRLVDESRPRLQAYFEGLKTRPAYQSAAT